MAKGLIRYVASTIAYLLQKSYVQRHLPSLSDIWNGTEDKLVHSELRSSFITDRLP